MTWSPETSCGHEQDKIAAVALQYLGKDSLDLGCGMRKCWPFMVGVDNFGVFGERTAADIRSDISDLSVFADGKFDSVFSSHALEDFPEDRVPAILAEWARVLKPGGRLCLYVPSANLYPKCGEPGANPHHRWNIYPGDIERHLRAGTDCGWTQLEAEERGEDNEYSLWEVYLKRTDGQFVRRVWERNPDGKQRALVCRFGAIGDQIIAATVLPGLKAQGYHVTYMTTPDAAEVLRHDPNIDQWIIQEKDACPNEALGSYWGQLAARYDRFINLSESVEGALLTIPGRMVHAYSDEARRKICGTVNYLDRTADIAGVERGCRPRFYPTLRERDWAHDVRRSVRAPAIVWCLHGSSPHKLYPWTPVVLKWLLEQSPVHVWLYAAGDEIGRAVQDGFIGKLAEEGCDVSRLHGVAGEWTIRQSLAFAQTVDCVVGPETGPLNAVSHERVPKVIYLSHSSQTNLTRDWVNTTVLEPDRDRAPCFPCHRLHADWSFCPRNPDTMAAACASAIAPERVFRAIALAMGATEKAA